MDERAIRHMEWIQRIIDRMSQNSFAVKAAAVALVSAALAFAVNRHEANSLLIAILPAIVFWGLDAFYLRQERLFRALYDGVRTAALSGTPADLFSMDTSRYNSQVPGWLRMCWTRTIGWLYGPMVVFILLVGRGTTTC